MLCCFFISWASLGKSLLPGPHIFSSAKEKLDCMVLQHLRSWILVIKYRRNLNIRRRLQDIGSPLKLEKLQSLQHSIRSPLGEIHDSQLVLSFLFSFHSRVTSPELHLIKLMPERQSAGWFSLWRSDQVTLRVLLWFLVSEEGCSWKVLAWLILSILYKASF